jgi:DNA-binding MarR family transcriptional regulator/GNAT superfamily N-acetyltransferase
MNAPARPVPAAQVKAVRAFNRFYTQRIGVLNRYLESDFTLTEVRVLYELAHRQQPTASELARDLALDAGYLSRILQRFAHRGWVVREPAEHDARQSLLKLTADGRAAFEPLQQKSRDETAALLATVPPAARGRLIAAMETLQQLLAAGDRPADARIVLRDPQPGDLGWVVEQHGALYASEYGFGPGFEALVAEIAAGYLRGFDPAWERGWIAELDGERAGSVFVVRKSATVAQLRLLILRPEARGLGLGGRLVDACIAFARERGYRKLVLWTNGHLDAARAIYRSRGFECVSSEPLEADYHAGLTSETWELKLRGAAPPP